MADVDPLTRPVEGDNLSVHVPAVLTNLRRSGGVVVIETAADLVVDSWDTIPETTSSLAVHIRVDATTGVVTITLPDPATDAGRAFSVIKSDAGVSAVTVTVADTTVDDLEGANSASLAAQWDGVHVVGRTAGWDRR